MSLHRTYAAELGIGAEELEHESPVPTTRGYADFLLRVAATGDFAELVAALLPCMWGFSEIGQRLARLPAPSEECYARWIAMYGSRALPSWPVVSRTTRSADGGFARTRAEKARSSVPYSSRYEWQFWEMAWKMERWQV